MKKLENLDIKKFYTNKKLEVYQHEERLIKTTLDDSENISFWLEDKEQGVKLKDIIFHKDKIVLLGNPGIGKTKELENLFKSLWNEKDKTGLVPFLLNIKIFKNNNSFEELIKYDDWKNLDCICFIIDGLDEIPDIESFLSALELFLERNDEKNIKIIVSCRTNIYEKFSVKIEGSEYFYLQNLTDKQIKRLLSNNFNIEISYQELIKYRIFLENPFNLNLFGNFYLENKRFPNNVAEAFELSINQELQLLNKEKFKKSETIDIIHIEKVLQKTAITSELMQKNGIDEKNLYLLLGKDEKSLFEKISLIEKNPESASFIFRHKNYQEFLAAKYISELGTDEIIDFIKIKNFNKTKPSLFNAISFLLNILDTTKLQNIKKWLFDHESEILFLMESERFDLNERKPIFKKYFDDIVINKTFWIGKNGRFSLENISKFADVDYLINFIKDSTIHFRIITSAYTILSMADLGDKEKEFFDLIKEKLLSGQEESRNVYEILRVIKNQNFHIKYPEVFTAITNYYKNDFDIEINHQIISMLLEFENIDEKFSILYNCLKKLYEVRPEKKRDNTVRGTKAILEKVFLRIHNPEYFIKILNILFNRKFDFKTSEFYDKNYFSKLIEKVKNFVDKDINFLYRIIDAFLRSDDTFLYRKDGFLSRVINVCEKKSEIFEHIINNYGLTSKSFFLLIGLYSKENIDFFLNKFKIDEIKIDDYKEIIYFIKWVFNDDNNLGYYFESQMQNLGFSIDEKLKLPTLEKIEKEKKEKLKFSQDSWNIFFDKENLFANIETVFKENEVDIMTWEKICEIKNDWEKKWIITVQ